jgi:cytochrome c peroxidase
MRSIPSSVGVTVALLLAFTGALLLPAAEPVLLSVPRGLDLYLPTPQDNPLTQAKITLGRQLFADPLLSRDRSTACATCHRPEQGFTLGQRSGQGIHGQLTTRHPPTLLNRAYGQRFFWDGRAATLEQVVLLPIQDPKEMDLTLAELEARLGQDATYRGSFMQAFGRAPAAADVARALASYVRSLLAGDSPYDRYLFGDTAALTAEARRGLELFQGKGKCTTCHAGPNLTDEGFHNTGVAWQDGRWLDVGRFTVTGKEADRGAFKTPTLREVARTAPYMHDGSLATLEDVLAYYDRGGNRNPQLDAALRPLQLTVAEKQDLVAFLKALSGTLREGSDTPPGRN